MAALFRKDFRGVCFWGSVARLGYFGDLFLASDSEPAFSVDIRLSRTNIYLARYRSPGKNRHLARSKFIKLIIKSVHSKNLQISSTFKYEVFSNRMVQMIMVYKSDVIL